MRPAGGAVGFQQPQCAHLRGVGGEESLLVQEVKALVRGMTEPEEGPLGQISPGHAQPGVGGEVGFENQALLADGEVAHWAEVVEVGMVRLGDFQGRMGAAQLGVLQLQLDLVDVEFVEGALPVGGQRGGEVGGHRGGFAGAVLGLAAERGGGGGGVGGGGHRGAG